MTFSSSFHHKTLRMPLLGALMGVLSMGGGVEQALAQDTDTTATVQRTPLIPTFGLGTGMFAFYGDIGRDHAGYSPLVARMGYELRATTPITPWLDAGLYALHGRVGANERGIDRNLNFESRITIGGLRLAYNFHHFAKPDRVVAPFVSIGIESLEFLSKTDLYDAQGRRYNYWSDGSIRDIAEGAPNAGDAVVIQRDYVYETDIRELDLDGLGKYPERTFAIPIGIGARMDVGSGFDFQVGATLHLTMTDVIDGVTDRGMNERRGNGRNDHFLFTSFSLGYAIDLERKRVRRTKPTISSEEMDLLVLLGDEDADGVPDISDMCPHTPPGVPVDARGCPLDSDGDGVPDYRDDEPDTPPGAPVNERGVSLTDDDFLRAWLNYKDSANVTTIHSRAESMAPPKVVRVDRPSKRTYVVQVGSHVEGITEEMTQRILSLPDVRTIESGDTTYYVVGDYDALPEAIRRQLALGNQGIDGRVMAEEGGRLRPVDTGTAPSPGDPDSAGTTPAVAGETTVRVQLGAFRRPLSENIFRDVTDLVTIKGDDGLTRYYTGSFTDINMAAAHKVNMLVKGFEGAFLVAFKEGKRVSIQEAGARLTRPEDFGSLPSGGINKDLIRFRVQVGTFAGNVPTDVMGTFIDIGEITPITSADAVRYYHGSFKTRSEAEAAQRSVKAKGITDAFVVGEVDGAIIPAEEAERLLNE